MRSRLRIRSKAHRGVLASDLFTSLARPVEVRAHHHKPYRIRHLSSLVLVLVILLGLTLQTGLIIGRSTAPVQFVVDDQEVARPASVGSVRSSYGFSFAFDEAKFEVAAQNGQAVPDDKLAEGLALTNATVRPRDGYVSAAQLASRLYVEVKPDVSMSKQTGQNPLTLASSYFQISSDGDFTVRELSTSADTLAGVAVQKVIYELTPTFGGGKTYAVAWSGIIDDRPFTVRVQGVVGSAHIPDVYQEVLDTLALHGGQKVAGVSTILPPRVSAQAFNEKYSADLVSPSVVKVYHLICGILVVGDKEISDDTCDAMSGSGFFVSSDGYIATNGHVVIFTAKDAFAEMLVKNPVIFEAFLRGLGLTNSQITTVAGRPDMQAAILAKIYDLSDEDVRLDKKREATLVALGSEPLNFSSLQDIRNAIDKTDSDVMKKAEVVAHNYSAKDLYILQSGDDKGFSSSDVALLKTSVKDAPVATIARGHVVQNEKMSLIGFPGDAENKLVARDKLSVSVTNGTISAIRDAAGGTSRLFQSDADASHGNSGGPAINMSGEIIGLLTYRFLSGDSSNATKSYVRDIADINKLAADKKIALSSASVTQEAWRKGLELVSTNRYSAAVKEFKKVKQLYPAHRLADSYIASSEQAIKDGKDVKDIPIALLIIGIALSVAALVTTIVVIVRHHAKHQLYKAAGPGGVLEHVPTTHEGKAMLDAAEAAENNKSDTV